MHLVRDDVVVLERADPLTEAVLLAVNLGSTTLALDLPAGRWSRCSIPVWSDTAATGSPSS